jgi:hypothetical protein
MKEEAIKLAKSKNPKVAAIGGILLGLMIGFGGGYFFAKEMSASKIDGLTMQLNYEKGKIVDLEKIISSDSKSSIHHNQDSTSLAKRKNELKDLINKKKIELDKKREDLARFSPLGFNDPKGDLYKQIEKEIELIQNQIDEAEKKLIELM